MAELTPVIVKRGGMSGSGLKWQAAEVTGDASDTVPFNELTSVKDTVCIRLDTGAEVSCTESTNVVTIGSGPSDTPLLIIVSGW